MVYVFGKFMEISVIKGYYVLLAGEVETPDDDT